MFPNAQEMLPLLPDTTVQPFGDVARDLVDASDSGTSEALARVVDRWVRRAYEARGNGADAPAFDPLANQVEAFVREQLVGPAQLDDARDVVARVHGFASWAALAGHLDRAGAGRDRFERATDAVVRGDEDALAELLREDPDLVGARSDRVHGASLLIYTAANGVEDFRQQTPSNVVRVAELLLDAGAEVDATAEVYGGACTTLGLAATSAHPRRAGVQLELLEVLLARGARVEDGNAGHGAGIVRACLFNGCPEAAAFLAPRGARVGLVEAAGLDRPDLVDLLLHEPESPPSGQVDEALLLACVYGHTAVAEVLVEYGADLSAATADGQTAAHQATLAGRVDTLQMLLTHNPPLEQRNAYGGTVLELALWSAAHRVDSDSYLGIIQALVVGGARLPDSHVPVGERIDAFLVTHGSSPDETGYWIGEQPRQR